MTPVADRPRIGVLAPPWIRVIRPDVASLAEAVPTALAIPRDSCRRHVAERFSAEATVDRYEDVMAPLLAPLGMDAGRR